MRNVEKARPLGFETLEDRILLAGDVSAVLSGATLFITGDGNANDVAIGQDDFGNITVQGNDGTSINLNSSGDPVAFAGVTNISVSLNGGDDRLIIGGEDEEVITEAEEHEEEDPQLSVAGWLSVATGTGNDDVRMSFTEVAKDVTIITDGGDDAVDLGRGPGFGGEDHVEPNPTLVATAEAAEEEGHEDGGPPSDVRIGGSLTIITCAGDDGVKVGFTDVQKNVTINSGLGNDDIVTGRGPVHNVHGPGEEDVLDVAAASEAEEGHVGGRPADSHFGGVFTVLSGQGDDMVVIRNTDVGQSAFFLTDGGNDALALDNVGIGGCTTILQGFGDDVLLMRGSDFGKAVVAFTGMGDDSIYVENNRFASTAVLLADGGNDAVTVKDNEFGGWALLAGGSGTDALEQSNNSFASFPFVFSFERNENSFNFAPVNQKINDSFFGFMMGGPVG
jgi:hypothetical protein